MASDVSSSCTYTKIQLDGATEIIIQAPDTVDDTDTIVITLADYGITTFLYATGYIQTTANSVAALEDPTTAVSSGDLTLTITGSTDNKQRVYRVVGLSTPNLS